MKAITTRSGVSYNRPQISSLPKEMENEPEDINECFALADLSASINRMPLSIWKRTILQALTQTLMILGLCRRTISTPTASRGCFRESWNMFTDEQMTLRPKDNPGDFKGGDTRLSPTISLNRLIESNVIDIALKIMFRNTVYLEELLSVINSDPNLSPSPVCEINVPENIKSSCEDPPDLELKDLPSHLEYVF
ncbi:hypothetical protein Tco_1112264 [Tanacetum coccineum]|uniref:Uncharacterized protein n=1 Tax=Tanacetum coccineum TaxID=301880 RepID=A0ABQ5IQ48_9ASTR